MNLKTGVGIVLALVVVGIIGYGLVQPKDPSPQLVDEVSEATSLAACIDKKLAKFSEKFPDLADEQRQKRAEKACLRAQSPKTEAEVSACIDKKLVKFSAKFPDLSDEQRQKKAYKQCNN